MDEPHLRAAFRYVAMNPVKAKLVGRTDDGLVIVKPLLDRVERLDEFMDMAPDPELETALAKGQTIGRPLMGHQALAELEKRLGRPLRHRKRGRRASPKNDTRQLKLV